MREKSNVEAEAEAAAAVVTVATMKQHAVPVSPTKYYANN